jgi:hypothetical protein
MYTYSFSVFKYHKLQMYLYHLLQLTYSDRDPVKIASFLPWLFVRLSPIYLYGHLKCCFIHLCAVDCIIRRV